MEKTTTAINVSITKKYVTSKIGMVFTDDSSGNVIITKIIDGGEVSKTSLKVGDRICSIDNFYPSSVEETSNVFSRAIGRIDISVERPLKKVTERNVHELPRGTGKPTTTIIRVSITKTSVASEIGMTFKEDSSGNVIITRIIDGGEVSKTSLKVGDKICSINHVPVSLREANDIFARAIGRINISVETSLTESMRQKEKSTERPLEKVTGGIVHGLPQGTGKPTTATITVSITKISVASKIGMTFNASTGSLIISRIIEGGEASKTSLKVGDKIVSINKIVPVSLREAYDIFARAKGRIDVSVETPLTEPMRQKEKLQSTYVGGLDEQGMRKGEGTMNYENGDMYIGDWMSNMREGRGTYFWTNGSKYEGTWINDQKEGRGRYYFPDGAIRDGGWSADKMERHGIMRAANGVISEGMWKNGELAWSDEVTDEYFYSKIVEDDGTNIHAKANVLVLLVKDIHQARLMYTFLNVSTKMGLIDAQDRKKLTLEFLKNIDTNVFNDHSVAVFKLILKKAVEDDLIDDYNNNLLDRKAEVNHTCNSEFIQDIRARIENIEKRVDTIEAKIDKIETSLISVAEAFNGYVSTQRVLSYMSVVINAMTLGVGGAFVTSILGSSFSSIVDFSDFGHVETIIKACGDPSVGSLLTNTLQKIDENSFEKSMRGAMLGLSDPNQMGQGGGSLVAIAMAARLTEKRNTCNTIPKLNESVKPADNKRIDEMQLNDSGAPIEEKVKPIEDLTKLERLKKVASDLNKDVAPGASLMVKLRALEESELPGVAREPSIDQRIRKLEEYAEEQAQKKCKAQRLQLLASEFEIQLDPKSSLFAKVRMIEEEVWPGEKKSGALEKRIVELENILN